MNKILTISGRAVFPALAIIATVVEIFRENELMDKMDDMVFFGLALLALLIGIFTKWRMSKYVSLAILGLAIITKIVAVVIEHDDAMALDPDYAIFAFMALGIPINMGVQFLARRAENRV